LPPFGLRLPQESEHNRFGKKQWKRQFDFEGVRHPFSKREKVVSQKWPQESHRKERERERTTQRDREEGHKVLRECLSSSCT
jgi:hypothetical protein